MNLKIRIIIFSLLTYVNFNAYAEFMYDEKHQAKQKMKQIADSPAWQVYSESALIIGGLVVAILFVFILILLFGRR